MSSAEATCCTAAPASLTMDRRHRLSMLTNPDRLFRAFSDRTRLRILHLLRKDEVCVGDLVRVLRVPQPTASRHLAYLRRSGLVHVRREGLWAYYSLARAEGRFHRVLLDCLGACFQEVPELERDAKRLTQVKRAGGCCP
jgi:ArsR family transcriptional regulator, arsenate/arsenite/antimonite-responsive transcriptional repressor